MSYRKEIDMKTKKTPVQAFRVDCVCEDCGTVCKYRGEEYCGGCKEYVYQCEECGKDYRTSERYPRIIFEAPEDQERQLENPVTEENLVIGVVLRRREDGYKFVVRNGGKWWELGIEAVRQDMDAFEYVCDRPHADGDFSYLCGESWCKCSQ